MLKYQTEYYRNSDVGQWRYYELTEDMTPKNIDWPDVPRHRVGSSPEMPFDRASRPVALLLALRLGHVHRPVRPPHHLDAAATGLRFPGRVVGAGGIYLEYDGRDVPDVATVVADFPEGGRARHRDHVCQETPIQQLIRGHYGSVVLGKGEEFTGYDFVAERPEVTHEQQRQGRAT